MLICKGEGRQADELVHAFDMILTSLSSAYRLNLRTVLWSCICCRRNLPPVGQLHTQQAGQIVTTRSYPSVPLGLVRSAFPSCIANAVGDRITQTNLRLIFIGKKQALFWGNPCHWGLETHAD